jgi:hypothetical protein
MYFPYRAIAKTAACCALLRTTHRDPQYVPALKLSYRLMKHQPVGRRYTESHIPASIDCPSTFNSIYRLIALIWRQPTGQVYCDAFSAARTDDYQVNDLTAVLSTQGVLEISTQGVLEIGDVARALAVDSND